MFFTNENFVNQSLSVKNTDKGENKKWIRGKFNWQEGYGVFSYSHSQIGTVINYIRNQETHHQKRTFKQEYLELLKKFEIPFEDKYVFDFIEGQEAPTEPDNLIKNLPINR